MATPSKPEETVSNLIDEDIQAIQSQLSKVDAEENSGHLQLNPHGMLLTLVRASLAQHLHTLELLRRMDEASKLK